MQLLCSCISNTTSVVLLLRWVPISALVLVPDHRPLLCILVGVGASSNVLLTVGMLLKCRRATVPAAAAQPLDAQAKPVARSQAGSEGCFASYETLTPLRSLHCRRAMLLHRCLVQTLNLPLFHCRCCTADEACSSSASSCG